MKVKRNDKCPCGSGKKFKKCCMNTKYYQYLEKYNHTHDPLRKKMFDVLERLRERNK